MNDLVGLAVAAIIIAAMGAKFAWLMATPKSDGPRIKRDYESDGARVISIKKAGFELGGRSSPGYRKYDVVVDHPLRGVSHYLVGVEATWFSDPDLKPYGGRFGD